MRKPLILAFAVAAAAVGGVALWKYFHPSRLGTATVTCGDAEQFESDLGVLNLAQLRLGQYMYVDTARLIAFHGGFLPSTQSVVTEPVASLSTHYAARVSVALSASVPTDLQAQAKEAISRSTRLTATGVRRETMPSVVAALEANSVSGNDIKRALAEPRVVPFVVHAVVRADSLRIGLAESDSGAVSTHLVVGGYDLTVSFECSQVLEVFGSQVPVFFKVTPIGYTPERGFFVNTQVDVDFAKVRRAAMAR
jgi:hypothetical protein